MSSGPTRFPAKQSVLSLTDFTDGNAPSLTCVALKFPVSWIFSKFTDIALGVPLFEFTPAGMGGTCQFCSHCMFKVSLSLSLRNVMCLTPCLSPSPSWMSILFSRLYVNILVFPFVNYISVSLSLVAMSITVSISAKCISYFQNLHLVLFIFQIIFSYLISNNKKHF